MINHYDIDRAIQRVDRSPALQSHVNAMTALSLRSFKMAREAMDEVIESLELAAIGLPVPEIMQRMIAFDAHLQAAMSHLESSGEAAMCAGEA